MKNEVPHAPGTGSDKQHPDTPPDANERFHKDQEKHQSENKVNPKK